MNALKNILCAMLTALGVLALTAAPAAAAPAVPDAEAQLDVMTASGVIQEEINDMYRTWDSILKSGMEDRSMYRFCAVVTDLDRNGRLELLISRQFLNKDPLCYAGENISEEVKQAYNILFSDVFLGRVYGKAYEISEDHTKLEPLHVIERAGFAFPDFTRIYLRTRYKDGHYLYCVDTNLMPRDGTMTDSTDRCGIVREEQLLWLDAGLLGVVTSARLEGTAGLSDEIDAPLYTYTSMKLLATDEMIAPYGSEAEEFERKYRDGGRRVTYVSWEELDNDKDARAALASSWYGWTYVD